MAVCPSSASYTIGWICPLEIEQHAALLMLDEQYGDPGDLTGSDSGFFYDFGKVGNHYVVLGTLPGDRPGGQTIETMATDMARRFPNLKLTLLVGIGGGAPSAKADIRLGDVVVGMPGFETGGSSTSGVWQHDYGALVDDPNNPRVFRQTKGCAMKPPPEVLRRAVERLYRDSTGQGKFGCHQLEDFVEKAIRRNEDLSINDQRKLRFASQFYRPVNDEDWLFANDVLHPGMEKSGVFGNPTQSSISAAAGKLPCEYHCLGKRPDPFHPLHHTRQPRGHMEKVKLHVGLIASGNQVVKNGNLRDVLANDNALPIACFEMEAGPLAGSRFDCLVIRGISDYSDSHKNDNWQRYAAATASAFAKKVLNLLPAQGLIDLQPQNIRYKDASGEIPKFIAYKRQFKKWIKDEPCGSSETTFDKSLERARSRRSKYDAASDDIVSGRWLLESDQFKRWMVAPSEGDRGVHISDSVLGIVGFPGCGKTVLSAIVVDHLNRSLPVKPLWYFFTSQNSSGSSHSSSAGAPTVQNMIRALIYQMLQRNKDAAEKMMEKRCMGDLQALGSTVSFDHLLQLFRDLLYAVKNTWIVIDGLHECCDEDDGIQTGNLTGWIRWLHMLNQESDGKVNIRILFTLRNLPSLLSRLQWVPKECSIIITNEHEGSRGDIQRYVETAVGSSALLQNRWKNATAQLQIIKRKVIAIADGMFLMASTLLCYVEKVVLNPVKLDNINRILQIEGPQGAITTMYTEMLDAIQEDYVEYAIRILQFVLHSDKPLDVFEAAETLIVHPDSASARVDTNHKFADAEEVLHLMDAFIFVSDPRPAINYYRGKTLHFGRPKRYLYIAHSSVREYFQSVELPDHKRHQTFRESLMRIPAMYSNARVCLEYLSGVFAPLASVLMVGNYHSVETFVGPKWFALTGFALCNWYHLAPENAFEHMENLPQSMSDLEQALLLKFKASVIRFFWNREAVRRLLIKCEMDREGKGVSRNLQGAGPIECADYNLVNKEDKQFLFVIPTIWYSSTLPGLAGSQAFKLMLGLEPVFEEVTFNTRSSGFHMSDAHCVQLWNDLGIPQFSHEYRLAQQFVTAYINGIADINGYPLDGILHFQDTDEAYISEASHALRVAVWSGNEDLTRIVRGTIVHYWGTSGYTKAVNATRGSKKRCDEYEWDLYEITLKLSSSQTLQQSDLFHEEGLGFRRWILDIAAQSSALRLAAVASFGRNNILRLLLESGTADINEVDYVYDPNHTTAAYATTLEVVYQCYLEEFQDSLKSSISDEMFQPSLRTLLEYSGLGADPCIANKTRDQVSPFPNNTLLAYAFEEHATMIEKGEQNLDYDPHNVHDIQIYEDKMQYYVLDSLLDAAREIKNKQNSFARSQYAGSWGNEELIHIVCELATSRAIALRMVQMLVDEYGGNVNHRRRSDKTTPLFIAIGRGHGDVARFLLARGAADAYSDPKSGLQLGYLHVAPGNQRHRRGSAMSNTTDGLSSMTSSFSQFSVGSDTGTVTSIGSDDGRYIEDFVQRDRHHELFFQNDFYVWEQVDKKYGSVREDDFVDSFHWTKKTQSQVKTVRRVIMPGEAPQRLPTSTWIIIKPDWKRYLPDDSPEKLFYMACDTVRFDLAAYMVKALINAFPGREMTNYRAPDGSSALFAACKRLNSGAVKEIIDHQLHHGIPIGVNEIPSTGFKGDENTMKLSLLQQVCGYGSSAGYDLLMHAPMEQAPPDDVIKRLQLHTTRLLVAAGADKQYACAMGGSAQFFAKASRNKKDLLEALGVQ